MSRPECFATARRISTPYAASLSRSTAMSTSCSNSPIWDSAQTRRSTASPLDTYSVGILDAYDVGILSVGQAESCAEPRCGTLANGRLIGAHPLHLSPAACSWSRSPPPQLLRG